MKIKKLQAKWYSIIKKKGFVDIEQDERFFNKRNFHRNKDQYRSFSTVRRNRYQEDLYRCKFNLRYYSLCEYIQHTAEYRSIVRRLPHYAKAWEMHTSGVKNTQIAKKLKVSRQTVDAILRKFRQLVRILNEQSNDESNCD